MSYDIYLCDKTFLRQSIEQHLGDLTTAPPFPPELINAIKTRLTSLGYLMEADTRVRTEFIHPNESWGLQAWVSPGEVSFAAPYWDDADLAIAQAKEHARMLAAEFDLGLTDQQDGEVIC